MSIRTICLAVLILALPTAASAEDLFKQAGIRTHGFHFLEGARAEFGAVDPEIGSSAAVFGINTSAGTLFSPSLDLTLGFRYWSADLDEDANSGINGSFGDFSLHGDLNYHIGKLFGLRPYGLAGLGAHFISADVPGSQQLEESIGGFALGLELGVGVATSRKGLGGRFEIRKEMASDVENWSYAVGIGWWPVQKAQRVPAGLAAATTTPASTTAPPAPAPAAAAPSTTSTTGGLSYAEAAAMQATIDRLRAENDALKAQAGGAAAPSGTTPAATAAATPESREAAQRAAFQRMASLSGDPGGFSETTQGCQFRSENFVNFPEGGAKLDTRDQEQIRRLAVLLLMFPGSTAELQGHGDSRGSIAANQKVTTARAEVVRQELLRLGVSAGAVSAQGLGASRPAADNATADGRAANRRVSVRVTGAVPR